MHVFDRAEGCSRPESDTTDPLNWTELNWTELNWEGCSRGGAAEEKLVIEQMRPYSDLREFEEERKTQLMKNQASEEIKIQAR